MGYSLKLANLSPNALYDHKSGIIKQDTEHIRAMWTFSATCLEFFLLAQQTRHAIIKFENAQLLPTNLLLLRSNEF